MKIVIIGGGEVGFHLAKLLSEDDHEITIIESKHESVSRAQNNLDVMVIEGNGASAQTLVEAGIKKADLLVAVSSIDEINIVSCMMAAKLFDGKKVARVRNYEYSANNAILTADQLGIDLMIHPEKEAADEIIRLIERSAANDVIEFSDGQIQLLGVKIDQNAPIVYKTLREVGKDYESLTFRTVAIDRKGRTIAPGSEDVFMPNDQVFVIAKAESVPEVLKLTGKTETRIENVMIFGGGRIGKLVAKELEKKSEMNIKIIEPDSEKSFKIAEQLRKTLVLNADATDMDFLANEGITDADVFLAVSNDQEKNIISTLLAKHLKVPKTIALVDKTDYLPIISTIGVDVTVSNKMATVNAILKFILKGEVVSVATLKGIETEAIEFIAQPNSKITKKTINKLKFPKDAIIGSVESDSSHEIIVPTGATQIHPYDRVVVFTLPKAIKEVNQFFA
ncbi:MAG: Trk system potassium transporter TrkA [Calditrichaeota bacterium]|nr:MAG: Trk system potassium transporter TrkA [Calditrichota bacterium]